MNHFICLITGIIIFLAGCTEFKNGPADMRYIIHTDQPGATIQNGDFISVHFIHRTQNGGFLSSSYETAHPVQFEQQKPFFSGDIFTGLGLLSEGDSATFMLNFDSMQIILNVPRPAHAKGKYLLFTVKVEKVIRRHNLSDSLWHKVVQAFLTDDAAESKLQEPVKINRYITANELSPDQMPSGLYCVVSKKGMGSPAQPGDTVQFDYTGRYITGKIFDTSNRDTAIKAGIMNEERNYRPDSAIAGLPKTIPAIDEALLRYPAGTCVTLIIPSALAYGEMGNSIFPPFTPLVFDLSLLNIKKAKK